MVVRYAHANGDHIRAALDKLETRYRPVAKSSQKKPFSLSPRTISDTMTPK